MCVGVRACERAWVGQWVSECACVCVRACLCPCVCLCVRARVPACKHPEGEGHTGGVLHDLTHELPCSLELQLCV